MGQQVQGDVEVLLRPVPFPTLLSCTTMCFPRTSACNSHFSGSRAVPGLRGLPALLPPAPEEAASGLGCAGTSETAAGKERRGSAWMRKRQSSCLGVWAGVRAGAGSNEQSPPWPSACFPGEFSVLSLAVPCTLSTPGGQALTQGHPQFPQCLWGIQPSFVASCGEKRDALCQLRQDLVCSKAGLLI